MKKCPYCAEEIQDDAIKCKHCGEFPKQPLPHTKSSPDVFPQYGVFRKDPYGKIGYISAKTEEEALDLAFEKFKDKVISKSNIRLQKSEKGKFSCPKCSSVYTECHKAIGCAVLIIIFISFGLGLIMIPFLPYECYCTQCGYKWKT